MEKGRKAHGLAEQTPEQTLREVFDEPGEELSGEPCGQLGKQRKGPEAGTHAPGCSKARKPSGWGGENKAEGGRRGVLRDGGGSIV